MNKTRAYDTTNVPISKISYHKKTHLDIFVFIILLIIITINSVFSWPIILSNSNKIDTIRTEQQFMYIKSENITYKKEISDWIKEVRRKNPSLDIPDLKYEKDTHKPGGVS